MVKVPKKGGIDSLDRVAKAARKISPIPPRNWHLDYRTGQWPRSELSLMEGRKLTRASGTSVTIKTDDLKTR